MPTYNVVCDGPGPHNPADGILGTTTVQGQSGMRCTSPACQAPVDPTVTNRDLIAAKIPAAIAANVAYLAIGTPTAAQNTLQVQRVTREVTALLRLAGSLLDDTSGT